jgi:GntR family phosphonate transport system transcriptional regulator
VLRITEIAAEGAVAEGLKLRRGRPVLLVERLAMSNSRPVVLGSHHFPLPRFAELSRLMREQSSFTVAMAACGVPDYRRHSTRITARMPEPEEAELLQQGRMRPVLVAEAINVDPAGVPVDYTIARYAAARVQLVVEG